MGLVDIGTDAKGTLVQAQVNERTGLDILIDGVKEDFEDLPTQEWSDVTVTFDAAHMTAEFRFHGDKEYVIGMKIVEGAICHTLSWPRDADAPRGLLGNANGNADDDLQTPNNVSLASNVTARQLYEEFGLIWRTTEGESLFVYDAGSSHATFIDPSFEPIFELPPTDDVTMAIVTRMCGGYEDCVYDYLVTGKQKMALASAEFTKQYEVFVEALKKVVSCGSPKTPSNGTKNESSILLGGVVTFSCNDGFRLEGSAQRTCTEQGEWSGVDVSCVEVICDVLNTPLHGTKNESSLLLGDVVTFSCNDGFRLEGSAQRTCAEQGEWNGTDVSCVAEVAKSSADGGGLAGLTIGVMCAIIGLLFV
ncbi:hypothetical protein LSAT2_027418 [Lamellibrachia satsuma]|nr:hypothetical protein LSAT2_027418 [Lamellibrachia satsuma]